MRSLPAHKQTDPAMQPGQIVNPIPMTDQEVYRFMNPSKGYKPTHGGYPEPKPGTIGEYARRKTDALPPFDGVEAAQLADNHAGMPVSEGEALCARILR